MREGAGDDEAFDRGRLDERPADPGERDEAAPLWRVHGDDDAGVYRSVRGWAMTERIQAAIEASRERQRALEKKWPSSYAADALETEATRFREALAYAVNVMKQSAADDRSVWEEEFARIERLLAGETEPVFDPTALSVDRGGG
jgi:hypothetical protein